MQQGLQCDLPTVKGVDLSTVLWTKSHMVDDMTHVDCACICWYL